MNILYFGTVCNLDSYENLLRNCNQKPSIASILFETALLNGLSGNNATVEIHSFPMIPTYPQSDLLHFGGQSELLSCGYTCRWLKTINVPVLKQLSRRIDAGQVIKKWAKKHSNDGIILTYSIPPFLVKDIVAYAKKFKIKTVAIVTDLLRDMYINIPCNTMEYKLKALYLKPALKIQGDYDAYIYLTEAMREVVAPDKPYMIMEGIADADMFSGTKQNEEHSVKSVMYAGLLCEKYGIINLLDAFEKLKLPSTELWLFGDGSAVPKIVERSKKNPLIRYFGSVSHKDVLDYECKATLLINPRDPNEPFTQYSFPSKTIEYMLSGTPLLTSRLKGIPEEYFKYAFTIDSNDPDDLADGIYHAFSYSDKELKEMGAAAQRFIAENKNAFTQSARVLTFLQETVKND